MADISKIKTPDGTTYNIKDTTARNHITEAVGDQIRVTDKQYTGGGSTTLYRKLAVLPIDNSSNGSSIIISGRCGGWVQSNFGYIEVLLTNRTSAYSGDTITAAASSSGSAGMYNFCDIVAYSQTDKSAIVYLKTTSYYAYDLAMQTCSGVTASYSTDSVTPTGTLIWSLSAAPQTKLDTVGTLTAPKFKGALEGNVTGDVQGGIWPTTIRPTSANTTGYGARLRYLLATSSMTTGKPDGDGHVLDMEWDNNGKWHGQLSVPTATTGYLQWRTEGGGTWTDWRHVFDDAHTVPVANGGTGQTTGKDAANYFMNTLDTGSSTPVDADYYISQYVAGGTTTTTYHRRPMSALWEYVKGKISSVLGLTNTNYGGTAAKATADASGNNIANTYVKKSGDTMTGKLTLQSDQYTDNYTTGALDLKNSNIQGVNSIYTSDLSDSAQEGIHFYRDTTHVDSIHAKNGALYFTPYRQLGTNGTPEEIPRYSDGQTGMTTHFSIRPYIDRCRANHLMFLPEDQVIIEQTVDGGATWTDAGVSAATKRLLFSGFNGAVNIPRINNARSEQCAVRITITGMKYDVPAGTAETGKYAYWNSTKVKSAERYFNVREWWFWVGSNGDYIGLKIERSTGANPNTWTVVQDDTARLAGWSGSSWVSAGAGATFGGGTNQTGNYWNWRLTFTSRIMPGKTAFQQTSAQQVYQIRCYGDSVWNAPNNFMSKDHLYNWDVYQNMVLPNALVPAANNTQNLGSSSYKWANVYSTTFTGNLTGSASNNVLKSGDTMSGSLTLGSNTQSAIANAGIRVNDVRNATITNNIIDQAANFYFTMSGTPTNDWWSILHVKGWTGAYAAWELAGPAANSDQRTTPLYVRTGNASNTWGSWRKLLDGSMLSSATNSSAEDVPATPKAVKAAYDLASGANTTAGNAMSVASGALYFKVTYSISGSNVVCAAHVYVGGQEVTTNHADSCFVWSMSLDGGTSWTSLGTGKTKTVSAMTTYGGNVKCDFTPAS